MTIHALVVGELQVGPGRADLWRAGLLQMYYDFRNSTVASLVVMHVPLWLIL